MFDFIKRCFKYPTLRELIDSYKSPVKVKSIGKNHINVTIDYDKVLDKINFSARDEKSIERYMKESEKELNKIERDNYLEHKAHTMRRIVVSVIGTPSSVYSSAIINMHNEMQLMSIKDFKDAAKVAYIDMFRGPFKLLGVPGARHFFSIYRSHRYLSLDKILEISQNSK